MSDQPGHQRDGAAIAWFAARTHAQRESLAATQLLRQGFPVYLPRTFAPPPKRKAAGTARAERPFFPGYVFVQLDLRRDRWRCVNSTIGVIGLVQFGAWPAATPRGFVNALIARTNAEGILTPDAPRIGDVVRIHGGPFDQMLATLCDMPAHDRASVLINMMTRSVQVNVARAALVVVRGEQAGGARAVLGANHGHQ